MNILQVSYYPTKSVITGGQRRIEKLNQLLAHLGHNVTKIAICPRRKDVSDNDFPLNRELDDWVFRVPYDFEMRIARAIDSDIFFCSELSGALRKWKPNLIWLEHPFLWPLIQMIFPKVPVIYSSHNVEWLMKKEALKTSGIFDPRCIELARRNEEGLSRIAAFILCCSENDYKYFKSLNRYCMVLPNGADLPVVNDEQAALAEISAASEDALAAPSFLFISSYHEPNWFGLVDLVISPLAARPTSQPIKIVLIGGVCDLFSRWSEKNALNSSVRIVALRAASEDAKNLALLNCSSILLPITQGGGTNLKTAEALLSGTQIIGTSTAFRGFENFLASQQVKIADTPEPFHSLVRDTADKVWCESKPVALGSFRCSPKLSTDTAPLSWDSILSSASSEVEFALRKLQSRSAVC